MLPTKFRFSWLSSFREEDSKKSTNLKQELPVAAIFVNESGRNEQSLSRTFHRCFLPVSVHLVRWFQRRRFLEIDQSETRMACGVRDRAGLRHCHHLRFLISFGDKIWPLAIFLAKTFSFSKII